MTSEKAGTSPIARYIAGAFGATLVIGLIIFFASQDMEALRDRVSAVLEVARGTPWAWPFVCALYLLSSAVMFPIIILNLATTLVFGAFWGFVYSLSGTLLSATVFFYIGRFGRNRGLKKLLSGPRLSRIDKKLQDAGIIGVATLRLVPIAPYGVFNMAAGLTSLRFMDYIIGTFLAYWPGGIARAVVGDSLMKLFLEPSKETAIYLGAGIVLWATIVLSLHFGMKKFRRVQDA